MIPKSCYVVRCLVRYFWLSYPCWNSDKAEYWQVCRGLINYKPSQSWWLLLFSPQSRKHANKVRLYYMLHPVDGGCPAKKLRTDNVSMRKDISCSHSLSTVSVKHMYTLLYFYRSQKLESSEANHQNISHILQENISATMTNEWWVWAAAGVPNPSSHTIPLSHWNLRINTDFSNQDRPAFAGYKGAPRPPAVADLSSCCERCVLVVFSSHICYHSEASNMKWCHWIM